MRHPGRLLAAMVLLAAGCGGEDFTGNSETISRADFGEAWPFTVEQGTLACEPLAPGVGAVTFEANGTVYVVNGTARQHYPDIEPIWADHPAIPGLKINIGPVIDRARELCG